MEEKTTKRIIILSAGIAAVAIFLYFDLGQYLTLNYIKESQENFRKLYESNRFAVLGTYMAIYVSLPPCPCLEQR